ncbi:rhodanese family protein [Citrobacter youngae]
MPYQTTTPAAIHSLSGRSITVIDIRSREDWEREHIQGALSVPVTGNDVRLPPEFRADEDSIVVFHCQSGMRTERYAPSLSSLVTPARTIIMQGGLNAWKKAGYPTQINRSKSLPLMRQVQIVAGSLALAGTLGGTVVSPYLYVLPGFVGAGLLFAGLSGWCGMAKLLAGMPWNRTL